MRKKGYRVSPHMFDVKPVDKAGILDMPETKVPPKIVQLQQIKPKPPRIAPAKPLRMPLRAHAQVRQPGNALSSRPMERKGYAPVARISHPPSNIQYQTNTQHTRKDKEIESFWGMRLEHHMKAPGNPAHAIRKEPVAIQPNAAGQARVPNTPIRTVPANSAQTVRSGQPSRPPLLETVLTQSQPVPGTHVRPKDLSTEYLELETIHNGADQAEQAGTDEPLTITPVVRPNGRQTGKPPIDFSINFITHTKVRIAKLLKANYIHRAFRMGLPVNVTRHYVRPAFGFAFSLMLAGAAVWSGILVSRGWQIKDSVKVQGQQALGHLAQAKDELAQHDFAAASAQFEKANEQLSGAKDEMDLLGGDLLHIFAKIPVLSKASSGNSALAAGQQLTQAAQEASQIAATLSTIDNPLQADQQNQRSLLDVFETVHQHLQVTNHLLQEAQQNVKRINIADIPSDQQEKFSTMQQALPRVTNLLDGFEQNYQILLDVLGRNGPRKYLFLFQNNQEMRATGGFIGSYGIMDISNGSIRNLQIDGIYNPDGQLREKVVPPQPIQKISATWSMHDANWFPHFPTSAQKVAWFYEKTGGPTVDGVITLTPTVLQKMLEITGPIEMAEYDTTVDADNFIEKTQYEVEVDYDKAANRPKQFIADLAPRILDRVFAAKDPKQLSQLMQVLGSSLREKHIIIYSFHQPLQEAISKRGWSGEVLQTAKDYLMVVNSNINGYKTDGMIDEVIAHQAEIAPDGSVIDTVRIRRTHRGGDTNLEWWNKVNADYVRVYVPKGSKFLSVKGQTREFTQAPLNYDQLGFRRDPDVEGEERSMQIDDATGTRIFEQQDKTVFANWVYVSPKETVELEYKYLLPFRVDLNKNADHVDTYSLLAQKQSGSTGSQLESTVKIPGGVDVVWKFPEGVQQDQQTISYQSSLFQDRFLGIVLQRQH